MSSGSS
jgi:hypothetical protein